MKKKRKRMSEKKKRLFRKEYLPIVIAIVILILLIIALVITVMNKPVKTDKKFNTPQKTNVEELVVPNNQCQGEEIQQLIKDSQNIESGYTIKDDVYIGQAFDYDNPDIIMDEYGYGLEVYIKNIPDNVSLTISNDQDSVIENFIKTADKQEFVSMVVDTYYLRVYTIKVYSTLESCPNALLREFKFTIPRWNTLMNAPVCLSDEYIDTDLCQPFVFDKIDVDADSKKAKDIIAQNEKENESKKEQNDKKIDNVLIICVSVIGGIIIVLLIVGVIKKKGKKMYEG